MGVMNCCSSRRAKQDKNVLDLDKELTGEIEVDEDGGVDKDIDDVLGGEKIGDIF